MLKKRLFSDKRLKNIWSDTLLLNIKAEKKKNNMDQAIYINADNIVTFNLLQLKDQKEYLLVCNTHLVFPAHQGDIKLSQIVIIMKAIKTIIDHFSRDF